jgi:predicted small secreted protein
MKFRSKSWLFIMLIVLISASLACNAVSGGGQDSSPAPTDAVGNEPTLAPPPTEVPAEPPPVEQTEPPAEPTQAPTPTEVSTPTEQEQPEETAPPDDQNQLDTAFPLPDDVQNFMQLGDDIINFQTSLSMSEVVDFYRGAFSTQGLTERTLLTVISDMAVSLVFDGDPSGMAIVLQCVDLGDGTTNVNLSYQDL